jgi:hypothetical protein
MKSQWRKSSYSGDQGNCVEVADSDSRVLVRDTKEHTGPVLRFPADAWRRFADQVKSVRSLASDSRPILLRGTLASESAPLLRLASARPPCCLTR